MCTRAERSPTGALPAHIPDRIVAMLGQRDDGGRLAAPVWLDDQQAGNWQFEVVRRCGMVSEGRGQERMEVRLAEVRSTNVM